MKKQEKPVQPQGDEALFEALQKNKKRKKRRILFTVICVVSVLAVAAVVGVAALRKQVATQFASRTGEVLSYEVSVGTIRTVVSGSGSLTDEELEAITVPEGVEITEILVKSNAQVSQGELLATVDMSTVKSALAQTQTQIEELDEKISEAEADEVGKYIYAGVSGRLKAVFAEAGAEVADVMYENGALAMLSLDGYMAVDIKADALTAGDSVTVTLPDGDTVKGTVETAAAGSATVLITDNGPQYQAEVTVSGSDGTALGSGTLYIHNPLRITGYAGTVSAVNGKLNAKVTDSTKLFTLKNTQHSANYDSLLRSRGELEETLLQLMTIQHDGALCAPIAGSVSSVDYADGGTAVATLSPDKTMSVTISVDESDILSLEPGQTVTVSVSSVSEDTFAGTLTEINKTATDGSYSAVVTLEKSEGMLSGMTASVSVQIEGVENALLIPVEALHQTSTGAYVYTSYNEELQEYGGKRDVVVGLQNSSYVEIKSGLAQGDTVYYTESTSQGFGGFGSQSGMGGFQRPGNSGQMPNMGGQIPGFGGSQTGRPSGSGNKRGQ